jgi:hypothetical protein
MAKFYVESGDFRVVVQAINPIPAAAKAMGWVTDQDRLDRFVLVNERGFVADRSDGQLYETDVRLETGTLFSLVEEHDFT